ncbi:MAG: hypothetical protein Q9178_000260 [Gyalolechia marmorata]
MSRLETHQEIVNHILFETKDDHIQDRYVHFQIPLFEMPSKKKGSTSQSNRVSKTAAKQRTKAYSNTQTTLLPSDYPHIIASSPDGAVVDPPEGLFHQDEAQEHSQSLANLDSFPLASQVERTRSVPTSSPRRVMDYHKEPAKANPPAKRKRPVASTDKRVTRAKKNKRSLAALAFKASPLARAHLVASNAGIRHHAPKGEAPTSGHEGASLTQFETPLNSSLRIIQPKSKPIRESTVLDPQIFPELHSMPALLAERRSHHQEHHQELTCPPQAMPLRNLTPWFPLHAAPTLPLPTQQFPQFSNHPRSPLNRSLLHDVPQTISAVYPLPYDRPTSLAPPPPPPSGSAALESMDGDNFIRSIVTYRRLGLNFDEIASKFHLAGFAADIVTAPAVEHIWRETDEKDFPPWYGDGVHKMRVFERHDPAYL